MKENFVETLTEIINIGAKNYPPFKSAKVGGMYGTTIEIKTTHGNYKLIIRSEKEVKDDKELKRLKEKEALETHLEECK